MFVPPKVTPITTLKSHPGRQVPGALAGSLVDTQTKLNTQDDIECRLAALIAKDGIRIKQFFIDFDKLRKGYCGVAAFRTCIGTLNISLSETETQSLISKYASSAGVGLIDYSRFCDKLNEVFMDHVNPQQVISDSLSKANFTGEEQDALLQCLARLRHEIISKRIHLKPGFSDFDRSKSQHVTAHQFLRVLKTLGLMPPTASEFALITRRYCDQGTTEEINYYWFCRDIDHKDDIFPKYVAKYPEAEPEYKQGKHVTQVSSFFKTGTQDLDVVNNRFMQTSVRTHNDPTDVEDRIRSMVVMKRIRIEEFFRDFDKLRKGRITRSELKRILSVLNFSFEDEEFEALCDKYKTKDAEVFFNYVAFTASINRAFTIQGIDKNPLERVRAQTVDDTLQARRKYLQPQAAPGVDLAAVLQKYRDAINVMRIHLKPVFQDFDINKNGHITKHQFLRVLNLLRVSTTEEVQQLILRRYMDKGNVDEVNYYDFVEDVDSGDQFFGAKRDFNHSWNLYPKTQVCETGNDTVRTMPDGVEDTIARIRKAVSKQRIRIAEFFRDFDKLRSGHITAGQFRIGLNMSKVPISNPEFEQLKNQFKAPKAGDHVCWKAFSDCIDEVFTTKGLEKNLDSTVGGASFNTTYGRLAASAEEHEIVQRILNGFTDIIRKERLDAKSFFQDWDRHNYFKVSQKQFQQVLTLLKFELSKEEIALIAKIYGNHDGAIRYNDFLRDANCLQYTIYGPTTEAKSTYTKKWIDFKGAADDHTALMNKIKNQVKKDRIRLREFFQDHDILRKGYLPKMKFRNVLYAQKVQLTVQEFDALIEHFKLPNDATLVNYVAFNNEVEDIFTEKDLEKNPMKTLTSFNAPSILDPKDVLNSDEEAALHETLTRLAREVRLRRLLIKPFFQDKDSQRSGFLSMSRFKQIFDNFKLACSETEFQLINKRFQAKAANEINYCEFDWVLREYSGDHKAH